MQEVGRKDNDLVSHLYLLESELHLLVAVARNLVVGHVRDSQMPTRNDRVGALSRCGRRRHGTRHCLCGRLQTEPLSATSSSNTTVPAWPFETLSLRREPVWPTATIVTVCVKASTHPSSGPTNASSRAPGRPHLPTWRRSD